MSTTEEHFSESQKHNTTFPQKNNTQSNVAPIQKTPHKTHSFSIHEIQALNNSPIVMNWIQKRRSQSECHIVQEKRRSRVEAATDWVDKEVKKLITQIQSVGTRGKDNRIHVSFKTLFQATENVMAALSATLKIARKRGVVDYDHSVELLLQSVHDYVDIVLLKDSFSDSMSEYIEPEKQQCTNIGVSDTEKEPNVERM